MFIVSVKCPRYPPLHDWCLVFDPLPFSIRSLFSL
jgi:hypothetical protein